MNKENIQAISYIDEHFKYPLLFAFKERVPSWGSLLLAVFVYLFCFFQWAPVHSSHASLPTWLLASLKKNWFDEAGHINIVIQFLTLFVVGAVWLAQLRNDWKASLDKFLSVEYTFNNVKKESLCGQDYAPLLAESDIRSMGQSIGKLRNDGFDLDLNTEKNKLVKKISLGTTGDGCHVPFRLYEYTIPLRSDPVKRKKDEDKECDTTCLSGIVSSFDMLRKDLEKDGDSRCIDMMHRIDGLTKSVDALVKRMEKNGGN